MPLVLTTRLTPIERADSGHGTKVRGPVEDWMTASEQEMKDSLHQIHKEGVFAYAKEQRTDWLEGQLGMVVLAATQVQWRADLLVVKSSQTSR